MNDELSNLKTKLNKLNETRRGAWCDVTLMSPEERLIYGCRDYEKWAKAYAADWKRERERLIAEWERANPL